MKLIPTDEVFSLNQVHNDMKISELKEYLEFSTGLPTHIQRVSYLDEGVDTCVCVCVCVWV